MEPSPEWLNRFQHSIAILKNYCKVCQNSVSGLKYCGDCMTAIYCSKNCQIEDTTHPCLIAGKRGSSEDEEPAGRSEKRRKNEEEPSFFAELPPEILDMIVKYLDKKEIENWRLVEKTLVKKLGYTWIRYVK